MPITRGTQSTGGGGEPDPHAASHQNGGTDEINVGGLSGLLADGQTPLAHAASHQNGGSDEITVADLSGVLADAQHPGFAAAGVLSGTYPNPGFAVDMATQAELDAVTVTVLDHDARHENGGADEIDVTGLSGLLADGQTPLAHAASHQNGGSDEVSVAGLSGLLADGQTPIAHATSHQSGGSDAIRLDDLAAPEDNTDLNASLTAHGLLQKLPGGTTTFLRADGTFAAPTASVGDQPYSPGSFTVATENFRIMSRHLKLTTTQRLTIQGTGALRIT